MKKMLTVLLIGCSVIAVSAQVNADHLLCENKINPVGVDMQQPRFSWQLLANRSNIQQKAYEIKLTEGKKTIWNSGKVVSGQSVQVSYGGPALSSATKYAWQVRVWDDQEKESAWSAPAFFQTALLSASDWKASWISPGYTEDNLRASPLFRLPFKTEKKVVSATAFITAHGLYEARINGKRVGDAYLTPGWTSYHKRLQYQQFDVTALLQKGENVVAVTLGSGWYRGTIGFTNSVNVYGKDIALLFQLEITYSDGSKETIVSDRNWKSSTGQIVYSEIYNGETIDARKEKKGWDLQGYDDHEWMPVMVDDFSKNNLVATENELVKKHESFKPVKIFTTPKGERVIDFGQNLVGWVTLKVKGNAGDRIVLSHAEVLDKQGNMYTDNLREAKAQDTYILSGSGEEIFEPHFTWQGFRFVKVEGYPGELKPENFTAVALYSAMEQTGSFTSSNPLVNQLQHNIQWGQKGNFLDVPTDCPQRDERLGWTGDAQVFSRTATFNMNVNSFFSKWLKDVAADQQNGVVPFVIPNVLGAAINSTGWADVATIIPWNMYLAYGDKQLLQQQYPSMKAYVESIRRIAKNDLWNSGFHFGDWLFYRPEDDNDGRAAVTDKYLIAQCFYANSTSLLIKAAKVLNQTDDIAMYSALLEKIKTAFEKEYLTPNGRLVSGTQTAYTLALNFDMLPASLRQQAADRLVDNIKSYGNHLTTGFLGTPYLCHVLTRFGYTDIAYKLLLQDTYPSWLYPVKMGATTIWERWDGQKPDSSFQTPGMNSFNHYSYGAIGDWMYRQMVGIDTYTDGVGYQHSSIKPHIGGGFTHAAASLQTYYGLLSNEWTITGDSIVMETVIPSNTRSTIFIPSSDSSTITVTESGKPLSIAKTIFTDENAASYVKLELGSGHYRFTVLQSKEVNSRKDLADYAGVYKVEGAMITKIEIRYQKGKLIASIYNNSGDLEPVKTNRDQFTSPDGSTVHFIRDANGQVAKIKMGSLGMVFEGVRQ